MPDLNVPIAVSTDDASFDTGTGNIYATDLTRIYVNGPGSGGRTGVTRFLPAIPAGKTIDAATLTLYPAGDSIDIGDAIVVKAIATDDYGSPAFGDPALTRTTASASWSPGPVQNVSGGKGDAMVTPSLAAVLQEIIDRPGWASGQGIGLVLDAPTATETGNTAYKFRTYDWNPTFAPVLSVTYSDGAGGTPVTLTVSVASASSATPDALLAQAHDLATLDALASLAAPGVLLTTGSALTASPAASATSAPGVQLAQAHALTSSPASSAATAPSALLETGTSLTASPALSVPGAPSVNASQVHLLTTSPATGPPSAPGVTVSLDGPLTVEIASVSTSATSVTLSPPTLTTRPGARDASDVRTARASSVETRGAASVATPRSARVPSDTRDALNASPHRSARRA